MSFYDFDKNDLEAALPEYRYVRLIGEGAYGKVYLLEKKESNQLFAVKRISCFGMNEYQLAGALNEVRILGSLEHPNIVKFYNGLFDNQHEHLYIFLEYANGGDVSQLIQQAKEKKKRVSENTVWRILLNVAEAVDYLHKHDIAHRDIKPANIFKDKTTGFKLGDLNVSKILPQGSMAQTRAGSPFYISPEVWNQEDQGYSFKCDIWSLGVVIYELCCLRVPFQVESPEQMVQKLKLTRRKSLPRSYSADLQEIVERMLEIDPNKRVSAETIIQVCRKNLKMDTERKVTESVLMRTIVVPQTNERWVNLVHYAHRNSNHRSASSRKSTDAGRRNSVHIQAPKLLQDSSHLMVPPPMMKRTSKTSKGSREKPLMSQSKQKDVRLPALRKYSIQIDLSNLSSLIQRKSGDTHSKNSDLSHTEKTLRSSRIKRNMVCQYIKEVRQDLATCQ